MISDELKKIIEAENSDLLDMPNRPSQMTTDERLINTFLEINEFIERNKRNPQIGASNIFERRLYSRLEGIRQDTEKIKILKDFDKYDLLIQNNSIDSIEEIINDDDIDLLEDDTGILNIKNIPSIIEGAEYKGRQKPCQDFYLFEKGFIQCHQSLREGKHVLKQFAREQQIEKGEFFILKGVMVYVAEVGQKYINKNGKKDARLRLIYENGTESDILLRTLARELYRDGRRVSQLSDKLMANFEELDHTDETSGYIYVLKSLSENTKVKNFKNLYKIGYSSVSVEQRIKSAKKDPTFFMAPVKIVATYKCYNLNPQKFEKLIHKFFGEVKLDTEIISSNGMKYSASEWFVVPLNVIDQVIKLIINGEIINYRYDDKNEEIKISEMEKD